jgi:hypothetical protein
MVGPYTATATSDGIRWKWGNFLAWESAKEVHIVRFLFRRYFFVKRQAKGKNNWIHEFFIPITGANERTLCADILKYSPADSPFRRRIERNCIESRELLRSKTVWLNAVLVQYDPWEAPMTQVQENAVSWLQDKLSVLYILQ